MARRTRALRRSSAPFFSAMSVVLLLLAFLAEDELAGVFHALALVGLGAAILADLGGDLPDLLLVDASHDDLRRPRRGHRDAGRDRIIDIVAVAERQLQRLAREGSAIADAIDLEPLLETFRDALDDVGDLRPRHTPFGARHLGLVARIDRHPALAH